MNYPRAFRIVSDVIRQSADEDQRLAVAVYFIKDVNIVDFYGWNGTAVSLNQLPLDDQNFTHQDYMVL